MKVRVGGVRIQVRVRVEVRVRVSVRVRSATIDTRDSHLHDTKG